MGLTLIIIAEFLWALEFILVRKFFPRQDSIFITAMTCILAGIIYSPALFVFREKLTGKDWIALLVLTVISYILAQTIYVLGIQKIPSAFAGSLAALSLPFFTVILGIIFLKESADIKTIVGGIVMIAGFLILSI